MTFESRHLQPNFTDTSIIISTVSTLVKLRQQFELPITDQHFPVTRLVRTQSFHGKRLLRLSSLPISVVAGLVWVKFLLWEVGKRGNLLPGSRIFNLRGVSRGFLATVSPKLVCYCRLREAYASYVCQSLGHPQLNMNAVVQ